MLMENDRDELYIIALEYSNILNNIFAGNEIY